MSRTRRFDKQALFSKQQGYLHQSQKKIGMMKEKPPFVPSTGVINTGSIWFWIFFLNMLAASVAEMVPKNDNHKKHGQEKEFTGLVKSRMSYGSGLSEKEMKSGVCDRIATRIGALAAVNDAFRASLQFVLQHRSFNIACATSNALYAIYTGFAAFIPTSNSVAIAYDMLNNKELAHELIHAAKHAEHTLESNCPIPAESMLSIVPVYPVTAENIKTFNDCIDLGDQRLYELFNLMLKERKSEKLFNDEKYKLLRAKKELDGTIPVTSILDFPRADSTKQSHPNAFQSSLQIFQMVLSAAI